jgi:adenine-specific DNA-methyltransferase
MSTHNKKQRDRLKGLLKELFQLDKPELDFGLYKIMHAKSAQITQFLDNDLLKEIEAAFGAESEGRIQQAQLKVAEAIDQAKKYGAPDPEATSGVKEARAAHKLALEGGNTEAEIYDHLYRFFERYYDNGDFLSKRYYARENDSRAAPYSVPYDGREVYLHWANKDQYYIKSGEYLSNFSFDLTEAVRLHRTAPTQPAQELDFGTAAAPEGPPLKVHMHLSQAQEGEHGNIKAASDQKREFIPLLSNPLAFNDQGELVLHFEYKVLPEGYPIDAATEAALKAQYDFKNKGDVPAHWMADVFLRALQKTATKSGAKLRTKMVTKPQSADPRYLPLLTEVVPTDTQKKRPLLAKYIQQYTARNTMDYFIHKDLGGFLKRELDFYIKNELMRLDDIESAEAPRVEDYLGKIKALRRIAHQLIAFLAQLEDFQKKLWLKKKFVTETQYCITLDRVPESLYPEIAANDAQREEWVKLFAIDEIVGDPAQAGFSVPLTLEFLKKNRFLVVDTKHFSSGFQAQLINDLDGLSASVGGNIIHSENFNALQLMEAFHKNGVKLVLTDPPYNTKTDAFPYKDSYKHSSWLTMMSNRIDTVKPLMRADGIYLHHIDENEHQHASMLLTEAFGSGNRVADIVWKNSSKNDESYVSMQHEYIVGAVKNSALNKGDWIERKEGLEEIYKAFEGFRRKHGTDWKAIHQAALDFYNSYPDSNPICGNKHYNWMDERGVYFPDNISGPNYGQYRYNVIHPITGKVCKEPASGWRYPEETMIEKIRNKEVHFGDDETTVPNNKTYLKETENQGLTSIKYKDGRVASRLLKDMFGFKDPFKNPKDVEITIRLLKALNTESEFVIDYFAGSGTTIHAILELERAGQKRKYEAIEIGNHFDNVLIPRIKKAIYSNDWKGGKPVSRNGISHCFKYLRLESYEDTLNNLSLQTDPARERALVDNPTLRQDYMLKYWLDVETLGSQSLLNVANFRDPTAYTLRIKQPGSDVQRLQRIDLIETFNWLIGLWVEHMDAPQILKAEFKREVDPVLPKDQHTRLVCSRISREASGPYWFRKVEGYTLKVPGDETSRQKTLVVWRKLTDDPEKDNAVLQHFLMEKLSVSPRESTYAIIYVNGSHTLPNPVVEGEQTKVRLIEEAFHQAMWSQDGA